MNYNKAYQLTYKRDQVGKNRKKTEASSNLLNKSKVYMFISLIFVALLLNSTVFSADEPTSTNSTPPIEISNFIPGNQKYYCEADAYGRNAHFLFTYEIKVDSATGDIQLETFADDLKVLGHYNKFLQLKDSKTTFNNSGAIKVLGHDKRVAVWDESKKKIIIKYFKDQKIKSIKEISCDSPVIDSESLIIYLQGLLFKGITHQNCNILIKAKGVKYEIELNLLKVQQLQALSPKNNFPDFFKELLATKDEYLVYEMGLAGVASVFYPHKFYFVYHNSPLGKPVAYWGGVSQDEEYYLFRDTTHQ
jgi:hypothetical protein